MAPVYSWLPLRRMLSKSVSISDLLLVWRRNPTSPNTVDWVMVDPFGVPPSPSVEEIADWVKEIEGAKAEFERNLGR